MRSITVSSSSARGSVVTVIRARGECASTAATTASLMRAACSTRSDLDTAIEASPITLWPTVRNRNDSSAITPGTPPMTFSNWWNKLPRGGVQQRLDGSPSEAKARQRDKQRDAEGRQGVAMHEAKSRRREADRHESGRDEIAGEMQRVRGQRVAALRFGDAGQLARADEIDQDRYAEHGEHRPVRVYGRGFAEAARGLLHDEQSEAEQQAGLHQGGEGLDLAMAIMMFGVRRLIGFAHREIGEDRRSGVDGGVARFGQEGQRTGPQASRQLGAGQQRAGGDRGLRGRQFARRIGLIDIFGLAHEVSAHIL